MKRYTFSNFQVGTGNRDAYDTALRIANSQPIAPLPVLILGDEGSGKTHLLYAIVNRLRASSSNTGLAYVTPQDFPDQVRALVDDPSPVKRAQTAVLLVDQLDGVDQLGPSSDLVEELEAVVRIFLDHHHTVVFASSVHPTRMRNLTDGLRQLIDRGQTLTLEAMSGDSRIEMIEQRIRQESADTIERQRREIDALRASLEQRHAGSSEMTAEDRSNYERRLEVAKAFGESLQRDLAAARDEVARLREETARSGNLSTTEDLVAARDEIARLRAQLEGVDALRQEVRDLEAKFASAHDHAETRSVRVGELEDERDRLQAQLLQAHEELVQSQAGAADANTLRAELEAARAQHSDARNEANRLLERAEHLLELVETNRARFSEVESKQRQQIDELERLLAERNSQSISAEEFEEAKSRALEALAQLDEQRNAFETRRIELEARLAESLAETQGVRDAHDRTIADRDHLRAGLEALQEENAELRTELGEAARRIDELRLRYEAAQQAAEDARGEASAATARIEVLEVRVAETDARIEAIRGAVEHAAGDLAEFADEMRVGAEELSAVAVRLGQITGDTSTAPSRDADTKSSTPDNDTASQYHDTAGSGNGEAGHESRHGLNYQDARTEHVSGDGLATSPDGVSDAEAPERPAHVFVDEDEDPSI